MSFDLSINGYSQFAGILEKQNLNLPDGYFLAQIGEYQQAPSGNPAVIMIHDQADTTFTKAHQLALYAHNFGMLKNNVRNLLASGTALMNTTGIEDHANYITNENLNARDPYLDKFRLFARGTYAVRDYNNNYYQLWTMNGLMPPEMKPGKFAPNSIEDIDNGFVKSTDYLYNPKETLYAFMVPNNFNVQADNKTTISPFAHGLFYDWTPSPTEPYQFFPVISKFVILTLKSLWTRVDSYQNPYRRL